MEVMLPALQNASVPLTARSAFGCARLSSACVSEEVYDLVPVKYFARTKDDCNVDAILVVKFCLGGEAQVRLDDRVKQRVTTDD